MTDYVSNYTGSEHDTGISDIQKLILSGKTLGNTSTPIYLSNGQIVPCTGCATSDALTQQATNLTAQINTKANSSDVNTALAGKASTSDITTINTTLSNMVLIFTNKTVATSAWASDSTYADYPFVASISCSGVTANHFPEVVFSLADATSGNFAPICESASGVVKIWAAKKPTATVTIPSIKCTKQK